MHYGKGTQILDHGPHFEYPCTMDSKICVILRFLCTSNISLKWINNNIQSRIFK